MDVSALANHTFTVLCRELGETLKEERVLDPVCQKIDDQKTFNLAPTRKPLQIDQAIPTTILPPHPY